MSATTTPPRRQPRSGTRTRRSLPTPNVTIAPAPAPQPQPHGRGGTVLFEVLFTSLMRGPELALLARVLDLSTHMYPKMRPDPTSPGVARLDHFSGVFLERGDGDGHWVLQARTWGVPAAQSVHEWHLLAAQAARQLDPRVTLPKWLPDTHAETPHRPLGQAAAKPLAGMRQPILGLT